MSTIIVSGIDHLAKLKEILGQTLRSHNVIKYKYLQNLQTKLQPLTIQAYRTEIMTLEKDKRKLHTSQIK